MSYMRKRRGLMGFGDAAAQEAPIKVGADAREDPFLASASLLASNVLLKMAAVPRERRLDEMERVLNAARSGLGRKARSEYERLVRGKPRDLHDQLAFDAIRAVIANQLVAFTEQFLAQQGRGVSGLGALGLSMDEFRQGFCIMGAGGSAITGGFFDQLGSSKSGQAGGIQSGAQTAANIAGCNIEQQRLAAQTAEAQARLAQSAATQAALQQAANEDRYFRYAMVGGGLLITGVVALAVLKPKKPVAPNRRRRRQ